MMRALYVPAGVPMWSRFTHGHRFSHLDLHLHRDRLLRILAPSVGGPDALAVLRRPVEIADAPAIATLSGLLVEELAQPARHPVFAESLAGSIATGLLDISAARADGSIVRIRPPIHAVEATARQYATASVLRRWSR